MVHAAFDYLPLAALIDESVLVLHGGLGDGKWSLDQLRDGSIRRPEIGKPFLQRICSRTLVDCFGPLRTGGGAIHQCSLGASSLLPSVYADTRYIDDAIAFRRPLSAWDGVMSETGTPVPDFVLQMLWSDPSDSDAVAMKGVHASPRGAGVIRFGK